MKHRALIIALVALASTGVAYASFAPSDWKYLRPITGVPNVGNGGYVKVDIDRGVSASSRTDLADLRIVSGAGIETPYQLVVESEQVRSEFVPSTVTDLSEKNGETMFIVDLGAARLVHDHLKIFTESKNFKRPVAVYASDVKLPHESKDWRMLVDKSVIYNYYDRTLAFDAGKGDVYYPQSTSRYLRVVIGAGEGDDVVVSRASVSRVLEQDARLNSIAVRPAVSENTKQRTTEFMIDLGSSGIATRRVTFSTDETKNFSRRVAIEASADGANWHGIGSGYVFSLNTPLFHGTDLSVSYAENLERYLRVIVFNQDDQPVHFRDTIVLDGVARSLVFAPTGGESYSLYYGNEHAVAPQYDLARFFAYIEGVALPQASLGTQSDNPAYVAPKPAEVPFTERNKTVINTVLVLLVAVVTFFLIGYLKKLKLERPNS